VDVYNQYHMGITAENVAKKYNISREAQDRRWRWPAVTKAVAAQMGKFKDNHPLL
jgi:acetyl-CoA C-acetyltransferase